MPIEAYFDVVAREQAGYVEIDGYSVYTVLHTVAEPVARVLLAGPYASDRHLSYIPWTGWARYLAARNIEVLRFDYRGVGESTGAFERMTFADWEDDISQLAAWLDERAPHVPTVLHGLQLGALLASRVFSRGTADALLAWSPPASANQALRSSLFSWVGLSQLSKRPEDKKTVSYYTQLLDTEPWVEVDGYRWSSAMWRESIDVVLPDGYGEAPRAQGEHGGASAGTSRPAGSSASSESLRELHESQPATASSSTAAAPTAAAPTSSSSPSFGLPDTRPRKIVALGKDATPFSKGGLVGFVEGKDFEPLFAEYYDWIASALGLSAEKACR